MSSDIGNIDIGLVATQQRIATSRRVPHSLPIITTNPFLQYNVSQPMNVDSNHRATFQNMDFLQNLCESSTSGLNQVSQGFCNSMPEHARHECDDEIIEKNAHRDEAQRGENLRKRKSPLVFSPSKRSRITPEWPNDAMFAHNIHQNSYCNPTMSVPPILPSFMQRVSNPKLFSPLPGPFGLHITPPSSQSRTLTGYTTVSSASTSMSQPSTSIAQSHFPSFDLPIQPTTSSVTDHLTSVSHLMSTISRQPKVSSDSHHPVSQAPNSSVSVSSQAAALLSAQLCSLSSYNPSDLSSVPSLTSTKSKVPFSTTHTDPASVATPFPSPTEADKIKFKQLNEDSEKMSDGSQPHLDSANDDNENITTSPPQTVEDESQDGVDYRNEAQGSIQVKKQQDLCNPSEEFEGVTATPLSPDQQINENSNDSNSMSPKHLNSEEVEDINIANATNDMDFKGSNQLTCSLCEFSTDEPQAYSEHVQVVHSNVCFECKFVAENASQLFEHRQVCLANNLGSASTSTKPKTKSKKLVCKVCKDEASDEKEFYNHRRTHISPDKILECKFCPFVTQYKHHLDYHMKNHTGNKPFKCQKCEYSCVNKSMLNSHMKSHSNFYSYRCKDCNYEAKYMHALKCHCRKYRHDAMPVLNPDGTVNPFPIVDVYGTRRGPKVKRDADGNIVVPAQYTAKIAMQPTKRDPANSSATAGGTMSSSISPPSLTFSSTPFRHQNPSPNSLFNHYSGINPHLFHSGNPVFNTQPPTLHTLHNSSYLNSPQSPSTSNQRHLLESLTQKLPQTDSKICRYCDQSFLSDELLQQHFILVHVLPRNSLVQDAGTPPRAPLRNDPQSDAANSNFITRILAARLANSALQPIPLLPSFIDLQHARNDTSETDESIGAPRSSSPTPLDLTKDHTPPQQIMRRCVSQSPPDVAATSLTPPDTCSPPKKQRRSDHLSLTNRRLEDIKEEPATNSTITDVQKSGDSQISVESGEEVIVKTEPKEVEMKARETSSHKQSFSDGLECTICDIYFKFEDMFKKHIAFHDAAEPLRCSFCKDTFPDSSLFFEHCFVCKHRHSAAS